MFLGNIAMLVYVNPGKIPKKWALLFPLDNFPIGEKSLKKEGHKVIDQRNCKLTIKKPKKRSVVC